MPRIIAVNKRECQVTSVPGLMKPQVKMVQASFAALTLLVVIVLRRAPIHARFVRHDVTREVDAIMSHDAEVYLTVGTRCHRCLRVNKPACWRAISTTHCTWSKSIEQIQYAFTSRIMHFSYLCTQG